MQPPTHKIRFIWISEDVILEAFEKPLPKPQQTIFISEEWSKRHSALPLTRYIFNQHTCDIRQHIKKPQRKPNSSQPTAKQHHQQQQQYQLKQQHSNMQQHHQQNLPATPTSKIGRLGLQTPPICTYLLHTPETEGEPKTFYQHQTNLGK